MARLAMDPRTRALLGQPDFMAMLSDVQGNPGNMNKYLQNDKFQLVCVYARVCICA
jgi:stress-induced-phosphoprotein 1